jgi:DNA repair photolyase
MEIFETEAKEIFTKTSLPGADWVINQYVGCGHACEYCYARFMSRWRHRGTWGTWVEAKMNAPELVKGRFVEGVVFMSSVSDAYQPLEEELRLTRRILENMDKRIRLSILTKSDLVLRDLDILRQFEDVEIGFTVNSFTGAERERFEPGSVSTERRIEAMRNVKESGLRTFAFVGPIVPGLIDVAEVIRNTKEYADHYWFEVMNLRGAGKEFSDMLKEKYPESYRILNDGKELSGYIGSIEKIIRESGITASEVLRH